MNINSLSMDTYLAMHGNGACYGNIITNSLEAFEKWYSKGIKIFEIDIARTFDNEFVAISHGLNKEDLLTRQVFNIPDEQDKLTKDWFLSLKLYKLTSPGLTPLSLSDVLELMKKYKDVIIILDTFGLFSDEDMFLLKKKIFVFGDNCSINERLLIEVYNDDMYRCLGGGNVNLNLIYCIKYSLDGKEISIRKTPNDLKNMGIKIISLPSKYIYDYDEIKDYVENGINILSYSEDNVQFEKKRISGIKINLVDNVYMGSYNIYRRCVFKIRNFIYRAIIGIIRRGRRIL